MELLNLMSEGIVSIEEKPEKPKSNMQLSVLLYPNKVVEGKT